MPVILLVVVAVVWIAILGRGMVRRRTSGGDGITSISDFHQQLRVLEHSSPPPIVAPAYRLRAIGGRQVSPEDVEGPEHDGRPVLTVVGAKDLPRPALAFLGQEADDDATICDPSAQTPPTSASSPGRQAAAPPVPSEQRLPRPREPVAVPPPDPFARQLARRRRRDTLGVLAAVFFLTMLAGFIPGASVLWTLTAVSGLALTAYVVLLVQIRRRADERERKLRYLDPWVDEITVSYPDEVSGRDAHPARGAASAR
ncbi:MAG: hypothetical protein WB565_17310 [Acidimicrobiales bacterium]